MRLAYLLLTGILSAVLALVAVFGEGFIRNHGADVLVVIWLYCLIRFVTMIPPALTAIGVLIVAFGVEFGQMVDLAGRLGLADDRGARLALGSTFDAYDFLAYGAGVAIALIIDTLFKRNT